MHIALYIFYNIIPINMQTPEIISIILLEELSEFLSEDEYTESSSHP